MQKQCVGAIKFIRLPPPAPLSLAGNQPAVWGLGSQSFSWLENQKAAGLLVNLAASDLWLLAGLVKSFMEPMTLTGYSQILLMLPTEDIWGVFQDFISSKLNKNFS